MGLLPGKMGSFLRMATEGQVSHSEARFESSCPSGFQPTGGRKVSLGSINGREIMGSPPADPPEQPEVHPKQNPALTAGIVILVAAGVAIFLWGLSQSRSRNPAAPAAPSVEERVK